MLYINNRDIQLLATIKTKNYENINYIISIINFC